MKSRVAIVVATALLATGFVSASPATAATSACDMNYGGPGQYPTPTATPGTKPPKLTFSAPATMATGRRYAFTFRVMPGDSDGYLAVKLGEMRPELDSNRQPIPGTEAFRGFATAFGANVIDGKVVNANGRPVDAPMLRVHPNTIGSSEASRNLYAQGVFRDAATGEYVCQTRPVVITH